MPRCRARQKFCRPSMQTNCGAKWNGTAQKRSNRPLLVCRPPMSRLCSRRIGRRPNPPRRRPPSRGPRKRSSEPTPQARLKQACAVPVGYLERLTAFWSNHFCVSAAKGKIGRAAAGAFEREAIRPHVLGRFADMLAAVERHPVDAELPRQCAVRRPRFEGGPERGRPGSTKTSAAKSSNCTRWASAPAIRRPTSPNSRAFLPAGRWSGAREDLASREPSRSTPMRTSRARGGCSAVSIGRTASLRARRRSPIWRASLRRRTTRLEIRPPLRRRFRRTPVWSRGWARFSARRMAISARSPARSSSIRTPGARRRPRCATPGS